MNEGTTRIDGFINWRGRAFFLAALAGLGLAAAPARAGFTEFFQLHEVDYTQTSNAAPAAESQASYLARPDATASPDFTAVTLTPPGGTAFALSSTGGGFWDSGLSNHTFATQAQLVTAFPTGTYTVTGTGGSAPTSASIAQTQSPYPASHPFLTGTSYSSLQGLNPTQPLTLTWDSFTPGGGAGSSTLFLTIFGSSGDVFNQFLPTSATSQLFPANTFQANTSYTLQLGWYSEIFSTAAGGVALDDRFGNTTIAAFTTGVPEPATMGMFAALLVAGLGRRRRPAR
jgi:hypothetical protein